jgi:hypothetical protein
MFLGGLQNPPDNDVECVSPFTFRYNGIVGKKVHRLQVLLYLLDGVRRQSAEQRHAGYKLLGGELGQSLSHGWDTFQGVFDPAQQQRPGLGSQQAIVIFGLYLVFCFNQSRMCAEALLESTVEIGVIVPDLIQAIVEGIYSTAVVIFQAVPVRVPDTLFRRRAISSSS